MGKKRKEKMGKITVFLKFSKGNTARYMQNAT